jgi:hypothetical protein
MSTRFLTILSTLVFLGLCVSGPAFAGKDKGCDTGSAHPSCGDGNTDEVPVYTALLTGNFAFLGDLTIKRKGKSLSGNDTLEVAHNDNGESDNITGGIFGKDCWALLTQDGVNAFEVPDGWGISYTRSRGGLDQIHITMNDLIIVDPVPGTSENYSQVDFDLHLHGEIEDRVGFLPESGSVSHNITKYMLWAGGHEEEGWFICNSTGGGWETWESLPLPTTLTITRQ